MFDWVMNTPLFNLWSLQKRRVSSTNNVAEEITNLTFSKYFKACVRYFYQVFIFSPHDSPSKTMKNAFYFI